MQGSCLWVSLGFLLVACSSSPGDDTQTKDNGSISAIAVTNTRGTSESGMRESAVVARQGNAGVSLPIYAPLYPGASGVSSRQIETSLGLVGTNVVIETADQRARVIAFYKQVAAARGRKIVMEVITNRSTMIMLATAADGEPDVSITVAEAGDGVRTISIWQQVPANSSAGLRAARGQSIEPNVAFPLR
jgi:hypothetical protein